MRKQDKECRSCVGRIGNCKKSWEKRGPNMVGNSFFRSPLAWSEVPSSLTLSIWIPVQLASVHFDFWVGKIVSLAHLLALQVFKLPQTIQRRSFKQHPWTLEDLEDAAPVEGDNAIKVVRWIGTSWSKRVLDRHLAVHKGGHFQSRGITSQPPLYSSAGIYLYRNKSREWKRKRRQCWWIEKSMQRKAGNVGMTGLLFLRGLSSLGISKGLKTFLLGQVRPLKCSRQNLPHLAVDMDR